MAGRWLYELASVRHRLQDNKSSLVQKTAGLGSTLSTCPGRYYDAPLSLHRCALQAVATGEREVHSLKESSGHSSLTRHKDGVALRRDVSNNNQMFA